MGTLKHWMGLEEEFTFVEINIIRTIGRSSLQDKFLDSDKKLHLAAGYFSRINDSAFADHRFIGRMRVPRLNERETTLRFDKRGAVAVEFAILSPLYLLLILGMTAYGIYFGASHSVQQISADAARVAISGLTEAERQALATDYVARNARDYLFIAPERLSVNVADSPEDANQFVVRLTYDASGLPIWGLFDGLSLPGQTIRRSSTIRIGGI